MKMSQKAYEALIARNVETIMWGDGLMVDIAHEIGVNIKNPHPLNMMTRMCSILREAPDLFKHSYVRGHDHRGHMRIVNSYKIIKP